MANILIVEDDKYLADDLKFFLERADHRVEVYNRADQVLDNLHHLKRFHWIILDIMMLKGEKIERVPMEMETGEVLYQTIRNEYPRMRVVVLSAKDFNDMTIKFEKESRVEVMLKPLNEEKINRLIGIVAG